MRNKKLDKEKILSKIEELNNYLEELERIKPMEFDEYKNSIEKKRACERLLQISVETIIDIGNILISNLKLGIPYDEDVIFEKLKDENVISKGLADILSEMKGFRNILVHKYGEVEDEKVFENLDRLEDFEKFKDEIIKFLKEHGDEKIGKEKKK